MCNRRGWHETGGGDFRPLYDGLTLGQKCVLHDAFWRDYCLTFGETLARLTAEREAERDLADAGRSAA